MLNVNFEGIIVGAATFCIIGLCHPLVIKGEYLFGRKCAVLFSIGGVILAICSIICTDITWSTILGAGAFSLFWGIKEVFEQEVRVAKGLFPENPKRKARYDEIRAKLHKSNKS